LRLPLRPSFPSLLLSIACGCTGTPSADPTIPTDGDSAGSDGGGTGSDGGGTGSDGGGTGSDGGGTGTDGGSDTGEPPAGPELELVDPTVLPLPTSTGLPTIHGFTVNARVQPHARPAVWRVEYGPTEAYGAVTPDRALPGRLDAWFAESWEDGTNGWLAGIGGEQLSHHPTGGPTGGAFVRYTDDGGAGNDTNHYDGIGAIHLGPYAYIGNYTSAEVPPLYLGGGFPDLRGARFEAQLRGVGWDARGTELGTWVQGSRDTYAVDLVPELLRRPNWAHTGELQTAHLASGAWEAASWTLRNRSEDWTFGGSYGGRMTYDYGELDSLLSAVDINVFALQILYVDIFDLPSGSWDMADLQITYRQHSVLAPSNGGTLVAEPAGGTGAELLTDGWRNGAGRQWRSAATPKGPVEFEYALAQPITLRTLNVHNATEYPSERVQVEVSDDGGTTWTLVATGRLPDTHPFGPNYLFLHADAWELDSDGVAAWVPLHDTPIDRLRVRILSGYQDEHWGLGEIEAFGEGALEETDDDWYDLTQDILTEPGTWHFRVIAETDAGLVVGPDQVVVVPER
jgi:hypothetical protein